MGKSHRQYRPSLDSIPGALVQEADTLPLLHFILRGYLIMIVNVIFFQVLMYPLEWLAAFLR